MPDDTRHGNGLDDLRENIRSDRDRSYAAKRHWEGTCLEYLGLVRDDPSLARPAAGEVSAAVNDDGVFDDFYGIDDQIKAALEWLRAGATGADLGKRLCIWVGPTASGKSDVIHTMIRHVERKGSYYAIKGCPLRESPLNLIPRNAREQWQERLPITLHDRQDLCGVCRDRLLERDILEQFQDGDGAWQKEFADDDGSPNWEVIHAAVEKRGTPLQYRDEQGRVLWERFPAELQTYSQRARRGIASFESPEDKSEEIALLVGRPDLSLMGRYAADDPRVYNFRDGAFGVANRGLFEWREICKSSFKILKVAISLCEEKEIKPSEGSFPHVFVDMVVLGHTNMTEWKKFIADKGNEAIHSRMHVIYWPYNLGLDDEERIYQKLIGKSSYNGHIAPHAVRAAAMLGTLSKLKESEHVDLFTKARLYNGEVLEDEDRPIDVEELRQEGRASADPAEWEGMFGVDPRVIEGAIDIILGRSEDRGCVTGEDIIEALREYLEEGRAALSAEEEKSALKLLATVIEPWYEENVIKDVKTSLIYGYADLKQQLFENYIREASAWQRRERVYREATGRKEEPDIAFLEEVEDLAGRNDATREEFRRNVLVQRGAIEGREATLDDFPKLREAIEEKLVSGMEDFAALTLTGDTKDPETLRRRNDALRELVDDKAYCERCARHALHFAGRRWRDRR